MKLLYRSPVLPLLQTGLIILFHIDLDRYRMILIESGLRVLVVLNGLHSTLIRQQNRTGPDPSSRNTYKSDNMTDTRLHGECSKKKCWFIIQKLYIYKYIDSFSYSKPICVFVRIKKITLWVSPNQKSPLRERRQLHSFAQNLPNFHWLNPKTHTQTHTHTKQIWKKQKTYPITAHDQDTSAPFILTGWNLHMTSGWRKYTLKMTLTVFRIPY